MSNRVKSIQSLLLEALEIPDLSERSQFLDQACGADASLRAELEELISAQAAAGQFLPEVPTTGAGDMARVSAAAAAVRSGFLSEPSLTESPGDRIGRYRLLQKIGEGGCGVVYMAEQQEPVRRMVALKVIKLGMDTHQVVARFEAERQALALMDHPNIAKVLEAGATDAGRPFFVMELVRGRKITSYCDERQCSTRQRLELFIQVCQAVQHAHQKGIIHRDLKPSNILVTERDGVPVPKVIDFGIAKATGGLELTDKTLFTAFEQFMGTPAYMSPEQAQLGELDIDTRSDIYTLGVLLYELLTGKTPFETKALLASGMDEMRRTIREKEPLKPSTRLRGQPEAELTGTARCRRTEPVKLVRVVKGDLDWIVLKCLEKDRRRRYETANDLALDIQRHLSLEPVMARPPSRFYEFQKSVRRHKVGFLATAAVMLALALGLVSSTLELVRARRAEQEQSRLRQEALQSRALAEELVGRLERDKAEMLFSSDNSSAAMAYLARRLRESRSDSVAASRLVSAMIQRKFLLPMEACLRHDGFIESGRFSPDGTRVITASWDGTARVWDPASGALLLRLELGGKGHWAGFSPDGATLVTTTDTGRVQLWEAATGRPRGEPWQYPSRVVSADFSPDGERIAVMSGKGAQVRDIRSGRVLVSGFAHDEEVQSVRFSPDGQKIVTAAWDGTGRVWDANSGQPLRGPFENDRRMWTSEFSPDGRRILIGGGRSARVYDAQSGELVAETARAEPEIYCARFSPDGRWIVTTCFDHTIRLWDAMSGAPASERVWLDDWARFADFSPDGRQILIHSGGSRARLWQLPLPAPAAIALQHGTNALEDLQFSSDSRFLASADGLTARMWDLRSGRLAAPPFKVREETPRKILVELSPDGQWLAAASTYSTYAQIWNAHTGIPRTGRLSTRGLVCSLHFSPDNRHLATGSFNGEARVWDAETGQCLKVFTHTNDLCSARFSPDGTKIVTASRDKTARIWDVSTGRQTRLLEHQDGVWFAQFSRDGNSIVTTSGDNAARVWDARTGRPRTPPIAHKAEVLRAEFSPDSQRIVTTSSDTTARIWSAETGQPAGEPLQHGGLVMLARFSSDGRRVITLADDHVVRIWDALSGQLSAEPWSYGGRIFKAASSPQGDWVAAACADGVVRLWEAPFPREPAPDWLPDLAEGVAGQRFTGERSLAFVPPEEVLSLKHSLLASTNGDFYSNWGRWFFSDPHARPLSPSADAMLADDVKAPPL